jgi:hypothetical protein
MENTPYMFYLAVGVAVIVALGLGVAKLRSLWAAPEMYGMSREEIRKRWATIRQTSGHGLMGAKLAVLEADNLLDAGLKSIMMPGATLGERLKVACYKYPKLQSVWWAHKLRNQIAHDAAAAMTERQAKLALDEFERALKVLNIL